MEEFRYGQDKLDELLGKEKRDKNGERIVSIINKIPGENRADRRAREKLERRKLVYEPKA